MKTGACPVEGGVVQMVMRQTRPKRGTSSSAEVDPVLTERQLSEKERCLREQARKGNYIYGGWVDCR